MKNFVQPGDVVTLTAPYAVASGAGAKVGSIFGVATGDVANAVAGEFMLVGVFDLPKLSTDVITVGAKLYWDDTNKWVTVTASTHILVGVALLAAGNPSATARVRLNGGFTV